MRNAERRSLTNLRNLRCGARPAGRARLPAFHRGSRPRDSRIPRTQLRARFRGAGAVVVGVLPQRRPRLQRAPRTPVMVPADMMSRAARERTANPSAGTGLAQWPGVPPDHLLYVSEDFDIPETG